MFSNNFADKFAKRENILLCNDQLNILLFFKYLLEISKSNFFFLKRLRFYLIPQAYEKNQHPFQQKF